MEAATAFAELDRVIAQAPAVERRLAADDPLTADTSLTVSGALDLFIDQVRARQLDVLTGELYERGLGAAPSACAGHEDDVVVGALLEPTDPCFLHPRAGALAFARARRAVGPDAVADLVGAVAGTGAVRHAGWRHAGLASDRLWLVPHAGTVASHLPAALGTAVTIGRRRRLVVRPQRAGDVPDSAIVTATIGSAALHHPAALSTVNAARWAHRVGNPVPLLLVVEDPADPTSVTTPRRWIESGAGHMLSYVHAAGSIDELWSAAEHAIGIVRERRAPTLLHLETGLLGRPEGHRGDPLARTALRLLALGAASPQTLSGLAEDARVGLEEQVAEVAAADRSTSREDVRAPLGAVHTEAVRAEVNTRALDDDERVRAHPQHLPEEAVEPEERTLAGHLAAALRDEMVARPEAVLFGRDVVRGGAHGVTAGLADSFGRRRVFDALVDETAILGLAQGMALTGLLPIPELRSLADLHGAMGQLRLHAGAMRFLSGGRLATPMVLRIPALPYRGALGGELIDAASLSGLLDVPGLVVAAPGRGDDAVRMLRGCLALAAADDRVVAFVEPVALYRERDLAVPGDGAWLSDYPPQGELLLPGEVGVDGERGADVLLVGYGNGVRVARRAARRLGSRGVSAKVLDVRWLAPLPHEAVAEHAAACGRVVVVDECRPGGGIAEAVVAGLVQAGVTDRIATVCAADGYVPAGPAADLVLLDEDLVVEAADTLGPQDTRPRRTRRGRRRRQQ